MSKKLPKNQKKLLQKASQSFQASIPAPQAGEPWTQPDLLASQTGKRAKRPYARRTREYHEAVQRRSAKTARVARMHRPGTRLSGVDAAGLSDRAKALDDLATARDAALAAERTAIRAEQAGHGRLRTVTLKVPLLIEGQLDDGDRLLARLARLRRIVPRTTPLMLKRARALLPVWRAANARLAALTPPQPPIARRGLGLVECGTLLEEQSALLAAVEAAARATARARDALLAATRAVDRLNKRFYKVLQAHADPGDALSAALAQIPTEPPPKRAGRGRKP
jgi:hypothetical protein